MGVNFVLLLCREWVLTLCCIHGRKSDLLTQRLEENRYFVLLYQPDEHFNENKILFDCRLQISYAF